MSGGLSCLAKPVQPHQEHDAKWEISNKMNKYRIIANGDERGPYTFEQLRSMWSSGQLTTEALYWQEGMTEWESIEGLGLDSAIQPHSLPPPVASVQRMPAASHHVQHTGRVKTKAHGSGIVAIGSLMCFAGVIILVVSSPGLGGVLLLVGFFIAVVGRMMS
jgi:hypothetical protein